MWDTLLLMALALVVFGPRRLPKIGRQLGKLMYEFRKASNDFKFQMEEELRASEEADRRKKAEEERQRALAASPAPAQLEAVASKTPVGASEITEPNAPVLTESPYSEGTDPNIKSEETRLQEAMPPAAQSTEAAIAAAQPTEPAPAAQPPEPARAAAIPQIQPPSTGEIVAAESPAKTQGNLFPDAEKSEPAAHHG
jgi:sec-independent protein translocase protein TatB